MKHIDKQVCPECGSYGYIIKDYHDNFNQYMGSRWWNCQCDKCGCQFEIEHAYKLISIIVSKTE